MRQKYLEIFTRVLLIEVAQKLQSISWISKMHLDEKPTRSHGNLADDPSREGQEARL